MAISLIGIGFLAGIALGQFFKVLILVPAMSIALIATIAVGIARADNVWSIALVSVAIGTALQIGYLIGIGLRSFIVAAQRRSLTPPLGPDREGGEGGAPSLLLTLPSCADRSAKDRQQRPADFAADQPEHEPGQNRLDDLPRATSMVSVSSCR
jgi:hypothetical protein